VEDMENRIKSENDLYKRVLPALRTKKHELMLNNIKYITETDIWNYNKLYNWRNAKGLTISIMVDNILNTNDKEYENYVLSKLHERDNSYE
jgi:hypothetical protein